MKRMSASRYQLDPSLVSRHARLGDRHETGVEKGGTGGCTHAISSRSHSDTSY